MSEEDAKAIDAAYAEGGTAGAAWLELELWLDHWRRDHPDDDRTDYELLTEEDYRGLD